MDKRAAVRVPVRVHAQCRAHGLVIDGLVEDVSRSGMFLRAAKQIAMGSSAEISIHLPDEEPVKLTAEVVRVDDEGMALRFVDGDPGRRPLANFIMKRHATAR